MKKVIFLKYEVIYSRVNEAPFIESIIVCGLGFSIVQYTVFTFPYSCLMQYTISHASWDDLI